MVYDPKFVLELIVEESTPIEVAKLYARTLVEERATELGKVNVWIPMTNDRQKSPTIGIDVHYCKEESP